MRGRRAVSYLLVPIALLVVAVTGSCTADLDEGMEGEGGSEGESVEKIGGNPDHLVAPTAPQNAEPPDDTAESCPVGQTLVPGDDNPNIIKNRVNDACIVTLGGGDLVINRSRTAATILTGSGHDFVLTGKGDTLVAAGSGFDLVIARHGDDEIYGQDHGDILYGGGGDDLVDGGLGADRLSGGAGDDMLLGGDGRDVIKGDGGPDHIEGGLGDDVLRGGSDGDTVVPGPGRDEVWAGSGDDNVIVFDLCEVAPGESYNGGSGVDTLVTPVPLADLEALGVSISGFEAVVVDATRSCEATCTVPFDRVPPRFIGLEDPNTWSTDSETGLRYRRTIVEEREANAWPMGTFLVEFAGRIDDLQTGADTLELPLPQADGFVVRGAFELAESVDDVTFVERLFSSHGLVVQSFRPTMHAYVSTGYDPEAPGPSEGQWLHAIAGTGAGVLVTGVLEAEEVQVDGPNPGWTLSTLPVKGDPIDDDSLVVATWLFIGDFGGQQFSECPVFAPSCDWFCANTGVPCSKNDHDKTGNLCSNEQDSDGDGKPDLGDEECVHHPNSFHGDPEVRNAEWGCDTAGGTHAHRWESGKSFALFGEGRFCTANKGNWPGRLTRRGWDTADVLNRTLSIATGPEGEHTFRYVAGGCWIFPDVSSATLCAQGGSCPTADAGQYPYKGAKATASGYYSKVWDDVQHGSQVGLDDALHAAQVVYLGNYPGSDLLLQCSDETNCCGAAPVPDTGPTNFEDLPPTLRGASVAQESGPTPQCGARSSAHELGHAVGLVHDGASVAGNLGFMVKGAHNGNASVVSPQNQAALDAVVDIWDAPRPSGFGYSGD